MCHSAGSSGMAGSQWQRHPILLYRAYSSSVGESRYRPLKSRSGHLNAFCDKRWIEGRKRSDIGARQLVVILMSYTEAKAQGDM